jgi:hypothetical protein
MYTSNGSRLPTRTFEPCNDNQCSMSIEAAHASEKSTLNNQGKFRKLIEQTYQQ